MAMETDTDDDMAWVDAPPTPKELREISLFQRIWDARSRLARPAPPILWHYTSGQALIDIVGRGEMWATQVSCLNDQSELVHSAQLLVRAFKSLRKSRRRKDDLAFLDRAIEELDRNVSLQSDIFVASFSEHENDLSQWRSYGGGEGGYVIGFNREGLDFGQQPGMFTLGVEYKPAKQKAIMKAVAEAALAYFRGGLAEGLDCLKFVREDALPMTFMGLGFVGPFLKNEAFSGENEWRVAWQVPVGYKDLRFRQKQSMLSRHVPLDFHKPNMEKTGMLPIVSVGVGPCRHPEVSVNSVVALLQAKGYPVKGEPYTLLKHDGFPLDRCTVWSSDIPFRGN